MFFSFWPIKCNLVINQANISPILAIASQQQMEPGEGCDNDDDGSYSDKDDDNLWDNDNDGDENNTESNDGDGSTNVYDDGDCHDEQVNVNVVKLGGTFQKFQRRPIATNSCTIP